MEIAFDPVKRKWTLDNRGLDFLDAPVVFDGPGFDMIDDRMGYGEERWITIGQLYDRVVVIVWTGDDGFRRIISMRHADADEQREFYGGF